MHSQGGKGIFTQFKKYLLEFNEENQKKNAQLYIL